MTLRWNGRRLPAWVATLALACTHKSPPRYVQISVGDHACARRSDGRVVCWGANRFGATGAREGDMEPAVVSFIRDATDVAAGHDVSCAVVGNGNVECWGFVWSADQRDRRQRIPGVRDAVRVLLAGRRACALAADGAAICWGPAEGAALVPREWPPAPEPAMRGAIEMSGREDLYCARIGDTFRCWRVSSPEPFEVRTQGVAITFPAYQLCTLAGDAVTCDGEKARSDSPLRELVASGNTVCGVGSNGSVQCVDTALLPRYWRFDPVQDLPPPAKLAGGEHGFCALTGDSRVFCWDPRIKTAREAPRPP